jgi:hypothetical protein
LFCRKFIREIIYSKESINVDVFVRAGEMVGEVLKKEIPFSKETVIVRKKKDGSPY